MMRFAKINPEDNGRWSVTIRLDIGSPWITVETFARKIKAMEYASDAERDIGLRRDILEDFDEI